MISAGDSSIKMMQAKSTDMFWDPNQDTWFTRTFTGHRIQNFPIMITLTNQVSLKQITWCWAIVLHSFCLRFTRNGTKWKMRLLLWVWVTLWAVLQVLRRILKKAQKTSFAKWQILNIIDVEATFGLYCFSSPFTLSSLTPFPPFLSSSNISLKWRKKKKEFLAKDHIEQILYLVPTPTLKQHNKNKPIWDH